MLDQSTFDDWLGKLKRATLFAFDTETTSLNYMVAEVVVSPSQWSRVRQLMCLWRMIPGAPTN